MTGNTITVANEEAILFDDIENDTVSNITIAENNIISAATEGIEFDVIEDNANATITVTNNQISDVGEEGIFFNDIQENATADITVTGNTITNAGDNGIELTLIEDNANVTATVTDNTITNPGANGVRIEHTADTDMCLALDSASPTRDFALVDVKLHDFKCNLIGNLHLRRTYDEMYYRSVRAWFLWVPRLDFEVEKAALSADISQTMNAVRRDDVAAVGFITRNALSEGLYRLDTLIEQGGEES